MNFNASPRVSAVGELATTQGDARSPSAYFRSPFNISFLPLPIFLFQLFFPPLTLGPNELRSLVAIGGQMCCRSCQCSGTVCAAKKKRKKKAQPRSHTGAIASSSKTVTMHKSVSCSVLLSSLPPSTALFFHAHLSPSLLPLLLPLQSPVLPPCSPPASPLKLRSVELLLSTRGPSDQ